MKKFSFLVIIAILISTASFSQTDRSDFKGKFMVGGMSSIEYTNYTSSWGSNTETFGLDLSPDIGYFFTNYLSAGLSLTYTLTLNWYDDGEGPSSNNILLFNPFLRVYVYKNLFCYAKVGVGLDYYKSTDFEGTVSNRNGEFYNYQLGVGYSFLMKENLSLDLTLGYLGETIGNTQFTGGRASVNRKIKMEIGFQVYL